VGEGARASLARALLSWVSRRAISAFRDCSWGVGVVIGISSWGWRTLFLGFKTGPEDRAIAATNGSLRFPPRFHLHTSRPLIYIENRLI